MEPPERFNLRWDAFEANTRIIFRKLREEREFNDVTVVADCGKQMEANKAVLAGGSYFFHKILKENPHPHPLIYLKGVGYDHLSCILDFVYTGEASISKDDLNDFIDIAQDLKVKGLTMSDTMEKTANTSKQTKSNSTSRAPLQSVESDKEQSASLEVSHPHCAISANSAPHKLQIGAEEDGLSSRISHHHPPGEAGLSSRISHPRPVISSISQGQVAEDEAAQSHRMSRPHCLNSIPRESQVFVEEVASSHRMSRRPIPPRGQVVAEEVSPSPRIPHLHSMKSAPSQGLLVAAAQSPRMPHPHNVSSSQLNHVTCEDDHDTSCNVKVEVGDAEHYNIIYGTNDQGEAYIRHVSIRGVEDNEKCIDFCQSVEEGQNDKIVNTEKKPKEEVMDSSDGVVITETASDVFKNEQSAPNWYEEQENHIKMDNKDNTPMVVTESAENVFTNQQSTHEWGGRRQDDENNMVPDGEQDLIEERNSPEQKYFQCTKTFVKLKTLKRHQMIHTWEKPYQCLVCSKMFSRRDDLNQHNKVHTGEKTFQCLVCLKMFSRRDYLKKHNRVHTGEKPYQCLHCSKSFSHMSNLNKHNRVHTGEKPYQCLHCSKSFSLVGNLNKHEKVHTGKKSFQCYDV